MDTLEHFWKVSFDSRRRLKDDGVGLVRINKLKRREDYRSQIQIPHHPNIPHRTISFTKTGRIIGPQTMQI